MADQRRELGKKILAARLGKKWKQKQLAAAVSVEPDTVSRWENGRHAPDLDTLALIAQATGKPLSFFVDEASPSAASPLLEDLLQRAIALLEDLLAQRPDLPEPAAAPSRRRG